MYLASARTSHWAAIDGDADGWMAFLDPWPDLDRTLDAITRLRNGIPPPIALRIDLTLGEGAPRLEERGRLHCRVSDRPLCSRGCATTRSSTSCSAWSTRILSESCGRSAPCGTTPPDWRETDVGPGTRAD